jgi:hypothetical protein
MERFHVGYYRSAVATIVNRARQEDRRSDIDQVVSEIAMNTGYSRVLSRVVESLPI